MLFKRKSGNVINYTDGEVCFRFIFCKVFVNREYGRRRCVFRTETVTATDNFNAGHALSRKRSNNVKVKGFAQRTGFFCSVKNGNFLCGLRKSRNKSVGAERSVKTNFDKTDFFAVSVHVVDNFFRNVADGTHRDDNAVGVFRTVVVEQFVVRAYLCVYLVHILFNDCGKSIVIRVAGFSVLEEDVSVFGRAAENGVLGVERSLPERFNSIHINHFFKVFGLPNLDLLNFVRSAEAVEEVKERNSALDGGKVSNRAEVHNLLLVGFGKHSITGLTASVYVRVVAENIQRVRSNAASGNVNNVRKQFACDLVHIRDHKKKSLRSRVGRCQSACGKRTVNRTCGTALGLHLNHLDTFTENISCGFTEDILVGRGPSVGHFRHRAGGSDRIDCGNFRKRIRNVCGGGVTVHGNLSSVCHVKSS